MRSSMSRGRNGLVSLSPGNLSVLQRGNYLLHSAVNSFLRLNGTVLRIAGIRCMVSFLIWWFDTCMCGFCFWGLARNAIDNGKLLWKIRPKHHQPLGLPLPCCAFAMWRLRNKTHAHTLRLDHLCLDQAKRLNPLQHSTYDDEDYVGKIKRLCMLAPPSKMDSYVLERYTSYVCCRWLRTLTSWLHWTPNIITKQFRILAPTYFNLLLFWSNLPWKSLSWPDEEPVRSWSTKTTVTQWRRAVWWLVVRYLGLGTSIIFGAFGLWSM